MKKLILILFTLFSINNYSQSMLSYIRDKVETNLSNNLGDRFKGSVDITDADESHSGYIIVSGTFRYQIKTMIGSGNTVTRKFKAKVKKILDDISVQKLCYVFIEYGYSDTPQKSCKCTDGSYVNYQNELFVE